MHNRIRFFLMLLGALFVPDLPAYAGADDVSDTYPFNIDTVSNVTTFEFQIGAAGSFYIDWGDGTPVETIENTSPATTYDKASYAIVDGVDISHTYTTPRTYTIKIGGTATAYPIYDGENEPPAAVLFANNSFIKTVNGSLGAIFSTLGDDEGLQPRFVDTFYGVKNLASVPGTLFNGVHGNASWQFRSALERCPRLTKIPANLFSGVSGSAPQMFRSTFYNDTGLTAIPENLFSGVSGTAEELFMYTFFGCSSLPDWLPVGILPDNTDNALNMFYNTFSNTLTESICPENMYRSMPIGVTWLSPVFCAPCPDDTIAAPGSTNIRQCYRGCDENQYFDIDEMECINCPGGSTSDGMITSPLMCKCAAGLYMNSTLDACLMCPAPYSQSVSGAVNETQCYLITTPGEYVVTPRASPVSCPLGKYCPGGAKIYYSDARYKPVDWIQSDGHAYIDTGLTTRPEYEYTVNATLSGTVPNASRALFGARANTADTARCDLFTATTEGDMRYDRYGTNTKLAPVNYDFINDEEFHTLVMAPSGILSVDDVARVRTNPNASLGRYTVALFGVNTGGTVEFIDNINKMSSYKVTDSLTGNVVQNMVSMYDTMEGEYGMYDTISATFYKNAGGGYFVGAVPDDADTVTGIFTCPDGYTGRSDTGAVSIDNCQAHCKGGSYMPTIYGECINVGVGYYSPAHFVNYGNKSPDDIRGACPVGLTTVGYGSGADEPGDCGKKLHVGNNILYLRSEKRGSPAFCVAAKNGTTFYADTTQGCHSGDLCVKWTDGNNYTIHNSDITH